MLVGFGWMMLLGFRGEVVWLEFWMDEGRWWDLGDVAWI